MPVTYYYDIVSPGPILYKYQNAMDWSNFDTLDDGCHLCLCQVSFITRLRQLISVINNSYSLQ